MAADRDEKIANLVALALEEVERGEPLDLERLCREDPSLLAEVSALMSMSAGIGQVHRASVSADPSVGRVLGSRYRLVERIGSGAAGSVWRAFDEVLKREVAVKLLHVGTLGGAAAEDRFLKEAEVLAAHEHPAIVRVYDRGRAVGGELFLVTELLCGHGLAAILEQSRRVMPSGPSPRAFAATDWLCDLLPAATLERSYLRQVVRWMIEICDGLRLAHADGVFHRDVKPSNVFVRTDGRAVLLDFGIAARLGDPALTLQTSVLGTPWYMPPEQARGRVEPAPTLDVYGVCATLYHLCALRAPHGLPDDHASIAEVLRAARERDPEPAANLHPGLPPDLAAILDHGLETMPTRRYATIESLADDLRAFLDHRPVHARPIGRLGRTWRRVRRHPMRALAILGVTAAIALGAVVWPLLDKVQAHQRSAEYRELSSRLPGDLAIEGWPDQRLLVPLAERDRVLAELDRILELAPDDLAVRLLRASEALDAGDHRRASADFAAIARDADDPYLRAVADRYARSTDSVAGIAAVHLADLPAPTTTAGHFIAGFHALRSRDIPTALDHLDLAEDFIPARDLRLLALLGSRQWERARDEALWLEGHYGHPTARTRHTLAAAAIGGRHYADSIAFAEESLRLRPDRHGPWNNLGYAHLRLGRVEQAQRCFERAIAIRPWFDNSRAGLCQTLRTMEDFDGAAKEAGALKADWWRAWELGNVELARAMQCRRTNDHGAATAAAQRAIAQFRAVEADEDPANQRRRSAAASIALAGALSIADSRDAVIGLLSAMRVEPLNPTQLLNLCDLLGTTTMEPTVLDALQLWLCEVGAEISPDDDRWQILRDSVRERIRTRK
jgi:serine/threonine-protein kinase